MIVGPTVLIVRNGTGTPAMAASSVKISWSSSGRAAAAVLLGPAQRQPAVAAQLPDDLAVGLPVAVARRRPP